MKFLWKQRSKFHYIFFYKKHFYTKRLNGTGPSVFNNYFRRLDHAKTTRKNSTDLWIPKVRSGKRGIYYSRTKIFNALPVHIKTEKFRINFKSALTNIQGLNTAFILTLIYYIFISLIYFYIFISFMFKVFTLFRSIYIFQQGFR